VATAAFGSPPQQPDAWLTAAETEVFTQNRKLQEAYSSGKNVSMAVELTLAP
jgi:hypothetical protein